MNNRDSSRGKETPNLSSGEKNRYNDARCKGLRQKPVGNYLCLNLMGKQEREIISSLTAA
jgi:hypothetical protein